MAELDMGMDDGRVMFLLTFTGAERRGVDCPAVPGCPDTQTFSNEYLFAFLLKDHLNCLVGYTSFFEGEDLVERQGVYGKTAGQEDE
jgi:hypothetical protein